MTVNHDVVGSSPTAGVLETQQNLLCFFCRFYIKNGSLSSSLVNSKLREFHRESIEAV
ncbi:hypothetical protein EMQU_0681 [Enterococcus mundtii QU 25]|uniref:Uncharacterized protein n=1 Tax=Enterococcus mundtii TaxID=53346 RepID=A0AAI8WEF7_ENTMU|nr:hypothetical protein EMQU_0681 [Enterococcus mundtii QU 25]BBM15517.1 uncharacterized protein EM151A_2334 [Enterococcus mundtii]